MKTKLSHASKKGREMNTCCTHRDDIIIDRVEDKRVRESLRARQFADSDHTMALRSHEKRIGIRTCG